MSTRVQLRDQVLAYQRGLAPQPRRALKAALVALARGRGDIKALEDRLAGLYRLRVGTHRVVFRYASGRSIVCLFAGHRSIVYEVISANLHNYLDREH